MKAARQSAAVVIVVSTGQPTEGLGRFGQMYAPPGGTPGGGDGGGGEGGAGGGFLGGVGGLGSVTIVS